MRKRLLTRTRSQDVRAVLCHVSFRGLGRNVLVRRSPVADVADRIVRLRIKARKAEVGPQKTADTPLPRNNSWPP